MSHARTLLGFDYGRKRIGVAVGQTLTRTTRPLTTLEAVRSAPDWAALDSLIEQWRPSALVVGLPLNMDGTEHELTQAARRFGEQLKGRYNLEVAFMDERLSSVEAEAHVQAAALRKKEKRAKRTVDMIAAQLILQGWLDQLPKESTC